MPRLTRIGSLPSMSWLASIPRNHEDRVAFIGPYVETFPDAIFEGAWAGDFDAVAFDRAATVAGSGFACRDGSYIFVPPSHNLECLYLVRERDRLTISNSLVFLMSFLDFEPQYDRNFGRKLASLVLGIESNELDILVGSNRSKISRLVHKNLVVSEDLDLQTTPKPSHADVTDFSSYRDLLLNEMKSVFENASSERRSTPFHPLSTCSSGYDSAAGTVLSAELGCREALTVVSARGGHKDDGSAVASRVGMTLHRCPRITPSQTGDPSEAEFLATGLGGEDAALQGFEPWLPRRLLVTGHRGGILGSKTRPRDNLEGGDLSGCSTSEHRLRVGFVHLPYLSIGALQHRRIHAITHSDEMRSYSVGGNYDRPIARRIVEEAGVPREAFGQHKRAASVLFHDRPELVSPQLRSRISRLERTHIRGFDTLIYRFQKAIHWLKYYAARATRKAEKELPFGSRVFTWMTKAVVNDFRTFEHNNPRSFFEFLASVELVRSRYSFTVDEDRA